MTPQNYSSMFPSAVGTLKTFEIIWMRVYGLKKARNWCWKATGSIPVLAEPILAKAGLIPASVGFILAPQDRSLVPKDESQPCRIDSWSPRIDPKHLGLIP